jgi:hypothetical protein
VPIDKGQAFTPEAGWSLQAPAAAQTPSWQDKGVTEKGGLPIMFNPKDTSLMVKNADGTTAPYDPKIHGKQLSATVNQTTIYNNQQGGQTLKPGTTEYWASIYETTGQVPSFGMGNKGAEQRRAFLDKVAERAIARGDGENGAAQAVRQADFKASQSTLTDLTKREQLINSYNVRINETSDKVLVPLIKRWDLQNPRFLNWPVNKLSEVMGSGDLASLKLALNSVSVEVGKVEFNAIGIQQLTDSASKFMNSVHDPNMKVGELIKVVNTSRALGDTGISAITKQRKELMSRMKGIKPPQDQPAGGGFDMNAIEAELLRRKLGK